MATLVLNQNPTLADLAKLTDPDGSSAQVARLMDEVNEVLQNFSFIEGNLPTGHRSTMSAGIPKGTWRKLYQGVQPNTGQRVQVTDNCGMLEGYGLIDAAALRIAPNPAQFLLEENMDHIEGLAQDLAHAIFYGNEGVNPEQITGLAPRYNSLSAGNKRNIIDAGGSGGDNRSIWLTVTSPTTVTGIVPKGSTAGIQVTDKGVQTTQMGSKNAPGGPMAEMHVTHYKVDAGVSLRNWKYVVRICNIDYSDCKPQSGTWPGGATSAAAGANLPQLMFQAIRKIPTLGRGRAAWHMSREMLTKLDQQLVHQTNMSTLMKGDVGGVMLDTFKGIPIASSDALEMDEARVT